VTRTSPEKPQVPAKYAPVWWKITQKYQSWTEPAGRTSQPDLVPWMADQGDLAARREMVRRPVR
jgi:hypothetical protein